MIGLIILFPVILIWRSNQWKTLHFILLQPKYANSLSMMIIFLCDLLSRSLKKLKSIPAFFILCIDSFFSSRLPKASTISSTSIHSPAFFIRSSIKSYFLLLSEKIYISIYIDVFAFFISWYKASRNFFVLLYNVYFIDFYVYMH